SLWLGSNDSEVQAVLLKPQEIPLYVQKGNLDCGLSGMDWIEETVGKDAVRILVDLCYSKRSFRPVRWVLAVAESSKWKTVEDLKNMNPPVRISTELRSITENWLSERGIRAEVDLSYGATEAKPPLFADGIVDCTETGASLRANRLRILDTVFQSTTQFIANRDIYKKDSWKRTKLDSIALLLKSCLIANSNVSIRIHTSRSEAEIVEALIPSDARFSVWNDQHDDLLFEVIMDQGKTRELVPVLARNGATRILVAPIDMLYG
ncbi:MAG: ATP phosphoribosyltransferase, partial [Nitrospirae bacterium]|nr:ATP phosphoribosyltransferase [Candidatus Troglogloeales bacterium]